MGVAYKFKTVMNELRTIMGDEVENHRRNLDPEHARDYIDHYIMEQEKDKDFSGKSLANPSI